MDIPSDAELVCVGGYTLVAGFRRVLERVRRGFGVCGQRVRSDYLQRVQGVQGILSLLSVRAVQQYRAVQRYREGLGYQRGPTNTQRGELCSEPAGGMFLVPGVGGTYSGSLSSGVSLLSLRPGGSSRSKLTSSSCGSSLSTVALLSLLTGCTSGAWGSRVTLTGKGITA